MMNYRIGIAFQTDKTPAAYVALAKLVNQYDFDIVSVYGDAPYHPSYGPLLLMAPFLEKAILGPAAVSPFRMHPIDIAANTALLAGLVQDRVYIGLVRGAWLNNFGISEPEKPLRGIREAITIIDKLLQGENTGFQGQVFRIADHVRAPYPLPKRRIPLMLGTWGPKMAALAGELADEVKIGGSVNPLVSQQIMPHINLGIKKADRKLTEVQLVMGAVTVLDEDRVLARRLAKNQLSLYLPVVSKLDTSISLDPEFILRIKKLVENGNFSEAGNLISDELLEKLAFAGNIDDILRQVETLFDAGVNRIEFGTPHGIKPEIGIKLLGERVIPWIRSNYFSDS